jgi:hypothetical protein
VTTCLGTEPSSHPQPPPHTPQGGGTSATGNQTSAELTLFGLLVGAGLILQLIGRRRRTARQH